LTPKMLKLFEQGHTVPIAYELIQQEFDEIYHPEVDSGHEDPPNPQWWDKEEDEVLVGASPDVPYGF